MGIGRVEVVVDDDLRACTVEQAQIGVVQAGAAIGRAHEVEAVGLAGRQSDREHVPVARGADLAGPALARGEAAERFGRVVVAVAVVVGRRRSPRCGDPVAAGPAAAEGVDVVGAARVRREDKGVVGAGPGDIGREAHRAAVLVAQVERRLGQAEAGRGALHGEGVAAPSHEADREDVLIVGDLEGAGRAAARGQAAQGLVGVVVAVPVIVDEAGIRLEPVGAGAATAEGVDVVGAVRASGEDEGVVGAGSGDVGREADGAAVLVAQVEGRFGQAEAGGGALHREGIGAPGHEADREDVLIVGDLEGAGRAAARGQAAQGLVGVVVAVPVIVVETGSRQEPVGTGPAATEGIDVVGAARVHREDEPVVAGRADSAREADGAAVLVAQVERGIGEREAGRGALHREGVGASRHQIDREDVLIVAGLDGARRAAAGRHPAQGLVGVGVAVTVIVDEARIGLEPVGAGAAAAEGVDVVGAAGAGGEDEHVVGGGPAEPRREAGRAAVLVAQVEGRVAEREAGRGALHREGIGAPGHQIDREDVLVVAGLDGAGRAAAGRHPAQGLDGVGVAVTVIVDEARVRQEPVGAGAAAAKGVEVEGAAGASGEDEHVVGGGPAEPRREADRAAALVTQVEGRIGERKAGRCTLHRKGIGAAGHEADREDVLIVGDLDGATCAAAGRQTAQSARTIVAVAEIIRHVKPSPEPN